MLTALAYAMILVFMALIMTKRLSAMVALILVPIVFGLLGGFGMALGPMMFDGIKKLAPTGVMLMFAILYFGIMIDAGLFDPIVKLVLRLVGGSPTKIVVGTFLHDHGGNARAHAQPGHVVGQAFTVCEGQGNGVGRCSPRAGLCRAPCRRHGDGEQGRQQTQDWTDSSRKGDQPI